MTKVPLSRGVAIYGAGSINEEPTLGHSDIPGSVFASFRVKLGQVVFQDRSPLGLAQPKLGLPDHLLANYIRPFFLWFFPVFLVTMASNLLAMASNLVAMAARLFRSGSCAQVLHGGILRPRASALTHGDELPP